MKRDEVWDIVQAKYEDYCDRIVQMVQRLPADCRQSGDDSVFEDVWEEFKYQVQRDESAMFGAYEDTISAVCLKVVEKLPRHKQDMLWLLSDGYFNWEENNGAPDKANDVVNELYRRICDRASDEDLKRDPDDDEEEDLQISIDSGADERPAGRTGLSRYRYNGRMFEAEMSDTIVTDTRIAASIPDSGDIIYLKAQSTDNGCTYVGAYYYRGNTYPPGKVEFRRENEPGGSDTFVGRWIDADGRDVWILEIDPPL